MTLLLVRFTFQLVFLCTIFSMSGRVVSADTNSNRRREFVCPIQHGRECCKLVKGLKNSSSYEPTSEKCLEIDDVFAVKIKVKVYVNQQNSVS